MNKLTKKFIWGVGAILLFTLILSVWLNLFFVERYYIHQKKHDIDRICTSLDEQLSGGRAAEDVIKELEQAEEVVVVHLGPESDVYKINESLRKKLQEKGIGFQNFWMWDQDYFAALENGRKLRIYNQEKLNYSLMVEYMQLDQGFFAVAMIIPDISDAIHIINTGMAFVVAGALLVACLLMALMVRRIMKPLDEIRRYAQRISTQDFTPLKISTGDELEIVAESMNQMGGKIQEYQEELLDKNRKMEQFLDDVAHELKTPVALVSAYGEGMKDGLDDGTFLDTIIHKNRQMGELVETLLTLSRMEQRTPELNKISLNEVLDRVLEEQEVFLGGLPMEFQKNIAAGALIDGNQETVTMIFSNLVSNAVKYSSGGRIGISLKQAGAGYLFEVENQTGQQVDTGRIWDTFYVGEESRNKNLSGTGLGLAIVKKCADRMGYGLDCRQEGNMITFSVMF